MLENLNGLYFPSWGLRSLTVQSAVPLFGRAGTKFLDCRPNLRAAFFKAMPLVRSVVIDSEEHDPEISRRSEIIGHLPACELIIQRPDSADSRSD
jgi:hypothetical protein